LACEEVCEARWGNGPVPNGGGDDSHGGGKDEEAEVWHEEEEKNEGEEERDICICQEECLAPSLIGDLAPRTPSRAPFPCLNFVHSSNLGAAVGALLVNWSI
jgi:hypothetical protein